MARSKRTRKVITPAAEESASEMMPASADPPPPEKKVRPVKQTFTAVLQEGASYELGGIVFHRGVPKEVNKRLLPAFKANGWFRVVE